MIVRKNSPVFTQARSCCFLPAVPSALAVGTAFFVRSCPDKSRIQTGNFLQPVFPLHAETISVGRKPRPIPCWCAKYTAFGASCQAYFCAKFNYSAQIEEKNCRDEIALWWFSEFFRKFSCKISLYRFAVHAPFVLSSQPNSCPSEEPQNRQLQRKKGAGSKTRRPCLTTIRYHFPLRLLI